MSTSSEDASTSSVYSSSGDDNSARIAENRSSNYSEDDDEDQGETRSRKHSNSGESNDSTSESESDEDDDNDDEAKREESMSNLPLGQRIKLEESFGMRKIKKKDTKDALASSEKTEKKNASKKISKIASKTKKSKHAPTEASSKRSDFYATLRQTQIGGVGTGIDLGAHRYQPKDPRISNLHGHLQEDHFQQNFAFVQDLRKNEIKTIQRNIHAWKMPGKKGQQLRRKFGLTGSNASLQQDQERLKQLRHEIAEWERQEIERAAHRSVKQKLQDQAATTGKFYFPKRRDLRKMQDEAKMQELRKRKGEGAVEKVLAKRRKKNKSKDASLMGAK